MSICFIYENGKGGVVDESGNEHFEMDIDTEAYPIDYIINHDEHLDFKPSEKNKRKTSQ
jgi:hypothetical protein